MEHKLIKTSMKALGDDGEIPSLLIKDQTISDEYGVLALCQIGKLPPHAFVAFEYLTPSTSTSGMRDRIIKRLDFRPDGNVKCIIGRGKTTQADVTNSALTKLKVGPFWRLKTEEVLHVPGFKNTYDSTGNENEVRVDDMDTEVYSSAGNSVQTFFDFFRKKVRFTLKTKRKSDSQ